MEAKPPKAPIRWTTEQEKGLRTWLEEQYEDLHEKMYGQIVKRALMDRSFRARLLSDPVVVFKEYGMNVRDGLQIRIFENTADTVYFVLPFGSGKLALEERVELADADLKSGPGEMAWEDDWTDWRTDPKTKKDKGSDRSDGNDELRFSDGVDPKGDTNHRDSKDRGGN